MDNTCGLKSNMMWDKMNARAGVIICMILVLSLLYKMIMTIVYTSESNDLSTTNQSMRLDRLTGNFVVDTFITTSLLGAASNIHLERVFKIIRRIMCSITNEENYKYSIILSGYEVLKYNGNINTYYKFEYMSLLYHISQLKFDEANINALRVVSKENDQIRMMDMNDNLANNRPTYLYLSVNQQERFIIAPNIMCTIEQNSLNDDNSKGNNRFNTDFKSSTEYRLILETNENVDILKTFITTSVEQYENYLDNYTDKNTMFLEYKETKKGMIVYDEYVFTSNKTFDNIFFEKKHDIKRMLDFFIDNEEFYKSKGFPYTLGFLFSGKSGAGKTSTIKAIANYTKRHIIYLKLNNIKNKSTLMDIIFSERKMDKNINYSNSIFVIEDIDCDCDIVLKRDRDRKKKKLHSGSSNQTVNSNGTPQLEQKLVAQIKSEKVLKKESREEFGDFTDSDSTESSEEDNNMTNSRTQMQQSQLNGTGGMTIEFNNPNKSTNDDKLTLGDLLNLIDGIIETPGRIMIITTNYPEKLDHALIRPGRIDMKVHFDTCTRVTLNDIFRFFFDGHSLTSEQLLTIPYSKLTPATVIQKCKMYYKEPMKCYTSLKDYK
jgi:hypothetical protein